MLESHALRLFDSRRFQEDGEPVEEFAQYVIEFQPEQTRLEITADLLDEGGCEELERPMGLSFQPIAWDEVNDRIDFLIGAINCRFSDPRTADGPIIGSGPCGPRLLRGYLTVGESRELLNICRRAYGNDLENSNELNPADQALLEILELTEKRQTGILFYEESEYIQSEETIESAEARQLREHLKKQEEEYRPKLEAYAKRLAASSGVDLMDFLSREHQTCLILRIFCDPPTPLEDLCDYLGWDRDMSRIFFGKLIKVLRGKLSEEDIRRIAMALRW